MRSWSSAHVAGFGCVLLLVVQGTAGASKAPDKGVSVQRAPFGTRSDGSHIEMFTLKNSSGMEIHAASYGGIITSIKVPDRTGRLADVVLGHDDLQGYANNSPYFGAIIGRYANRIANAKFLLDGKTYQLAANDPPNTLHGGIKGFDQAMWQGVPFERPGEAGVVLTHTSHDGDEGFPGTLVVEVTYTLSDRNELAVNYSARTDKPTVVNLTQHTYFNLAGEGAGDVLNHEVIIHADRYTPVNETLIPTGEIADVAGTPFDFRRKMRIGERIETDDPQLRRGKGYDHNYVLNGAPGRLRVAARVEEPTTGRVLEVYTTEPGMQFYTGNVLDGSITGKKGHVYGPRTGFCLETQHYPDSPNQPAFPSTRLAPGEHFQSRTVFRFSTY